MVFIIPIIFGVVAVVTAGMGIAALFDGLDKTQQAEEIREKAEKRYQSKQKHVQLTEEQTRKQLNEYNLIRVQIRKDTVERFKHLAEKINQKVSVREPEFLQGFEEDFEGATPPEINSYRDSDAKAIINIGATLGAMGVTAAGAFKGAFVLAALVGTASTGTAIGTLSGAAATNATLAWFGGGALAAGGGGMALGSLIVGGVSLGLALMVGGFMFGGKGEKDLTQAVEYEAQVDAAVAKHDAYIHYLKDGVQRQIQEREKILKFLDDHCQIALKDLETAIQQGFNIQRDAEKYQKAALLVKALMEIIRTPILDPKAT
ncbi:MAG TPA: hypothetical protein IGP91_07165 [Thermosynechococcus sp. M46_R2017_013]|nr:hypothetical protein [Thermosynechococcus sp. M46_R2017_013]